MLFCNLTIDYYMFFIIGIFIAIFLLLLLLIKKNKSRADKILVIWLCLMAIHQFYHYLFINGIIFQYPKWIGVNFPFPVLQGVLLYFYVLEITGNSLDKLWKIVLHLVPALSLILFAIPFYNLSDIEKTKVIQNDGLGFEAYVMYINILIPLSGLAYSIWSLFLVQKHQKTILDRFSNTDKKELQWLRYLSIGFGIIWILSIFFESEIIFTAVVVMVMFIGFFGINQLNIFSTNSTIEVEVNDNFKNTETKSNTIDTPKLKRYEKSGLNETMALHIYKNLNILVKENAIYKNEDLTLVELAKQLKVHPNHLSQVINEMEGKNFYNYINSLRIKEFIKLASIQENKKYTMISLAYDCGFSTKSTFNKHFKLQTGKTPTEFLNHT